MMYWVYSRSMEHTEAWVRGKFRAPFADANIAAMQKELGQEIKLDAAGKAEWVERWHEKLRRVGHGCAENDEMMNKAAPDSISYAKMWAR